MFGKALKRIAYVDVKTGSINEKKSDCDVFGR